MTSGPETLPDGHDAASPTRPTTPTPSDDASPAPTDRDTRRTHRRHRRARLLRAAQGDRRPVPAARTAARRTAVAGPLPHRVGARARQDAGRRDARRRRRRDVRAHPVHARPAAVRHRRHPHLPGQHRAVRRRARPGVRQLPAHRRDQPGARQGAVGVARGDGRAAGVDRRRHAPRAATVPRRRHAEPDRERGRLPAPRRPARPVHDEDPHRLPERDRGARDPRPDVGSGADRVAGDLARAAEGAAGRGRLGVRRSFGGALRDRPRPGHPPPRTVSASTTCRRRSVSA